VIEDIKIPDQISGALFSFCLGEDPTWKQLCDFDPMMTRSLLAFFNYSDEELKEFEHHGHPLHRSDLEPYLHHQVCGLLLIF
jgi:hypothetical protein